MHSIVSYRIFEFFQNVYMPLILTTHEGVRQGASWASVTICRSTPTLIDGSAVTFCTAKSYRVWATPLHQNGCRIEGGSSLDETFWGPGRHHCVYQYSVNVPPSNHISTSRSAVAKRPRDALCLSVNQVI